MYLVCWVVCFVFYRGKTAAAETPCASYQHSTRAARWSCATAPAAGGLLTQQQKRQQHYNSSLVVHDLMISSQTHRPLTLLFYCRTVSAPGLGKKQRNDSVLSFFLLVHFAIPLSYCCIQSLGRALATHGMCDYAHVSQGTYTANSVDHGVPPSSAVCFDEAVTNPFETHEKNDQTNKRSDVAVRLRQERCSGVCRRIAILHARVARRSLRYSSSNTYSIPYIPLPTAARAALCSRGLLSAYFSSGSLERDTRYNAV